MWKRVEDKAIVVEFDGRVMPLPEDFHSFDVPQDAKEICKNWFYKVFSIRELMARIYVEMAILPCKKFLTDDMDEIKRGSFFFDYFFLK